MATHVLDVRDAARFHLEARVVDEIGREAIEDVFQRFIEFQLPQPARMAPFHIRVSRVEYGNFHAQLLEIEEARLETVVEIGCVVGDFVDRSISCASSGGCSSRRYSASAGNSVAAE